MLDESREPREMDWWRSHRSHGLVNLGYIPAVDWDDEVVSVDKVMVSDMIVGNRLFFVCRVSDDIV
jgi:hypothetical protein